MFDTLYFMSDVVNSLAEFVRKTLALKGLTYRDVADKSGGLISHSAVYDILNGRSLNPKTETLKGLAKGLGTSEEEVFAAARGAKPIQENVDFSDNAGIFRDLNNLPPERKQIAKKQIRAIIDAMKENPNHSFDYVDDDA